MTATARRPSLGRRWRRTVLRVQGELDGDAADRLLPWVFSAGWFAVLVALNAAAIRSLDGGSGLGPWIQAAWRREHGGAVTHVGGADPARATWSFVSEPILQLARILPPEAVFVTVQAAALAIAIVPLWRLAREEAHLRVGATSVVVAAFALAPTLHRTNVSAFHPEAIALPALLWAYLNARRERWVSYGLLIALVLATRADLGFTVAALGVLLSGTGTRRAGLVTGIVGGFWTVIAVLVLDPAVPTTELTPSGEFVARATTPLAVLPDLVTDPIGVIGQLLAEPSVAFLVIVLAPLLFLPLVSPRTFAVALPCLLAAMIADTAVQEVAQLGVVNLSPAAAHVAPAIAFVFVALVFALERIGDRSVTRINVDHRVLLALLAGASLLFLTEAPTSPYREPWAWGSRDAIDGARLEAAEIFAADDAVAVSPPSTSTVADRAHVIELPLDPADLDARAIREVATAVDGVLLDTVGTDPLTGTPFWTDEEIERVVAAFGRHDLAVAYRAQGIVVLVDQSGTG